MRRPSVTASVAASVAAALSLGSAGAAQADVIGGDQGARMAVTADVWNSAYADETSSICHGIAAGVVRRWLSPRLWVQAGLGVARSNLELADDQIGRVVRETGYAPAAVAGAGLEVLATDFVEVDLELKAGGGEREGDLEVYNLRLGATLRLR